MNEADHRVTDKETPDVSNVKNPDVAHERTDVDILGILMFAIGLLAITFVIYVTLWWMFDFFAVREARFQPPPSTLVRSGQQQLPPEPRLQGAPGHETPPLDELKQVQASEDAVLNNYGWVDQQEGIVRIPIEQAMKRLVEKGLPSRPAGGGQETEYQRLGQIPQASSSGRTMERRQP